MLLLLLFIKLWSNRQRASSSVSQDLCTNTPLPESVPLQNSGWPHPFTQGLAQPSSQRGLRGHAVQSAPIWQADHMRWQIVNTFGLMGHMISVTSISAVIARNSLFLYVIFFSKQLSLSTKIMAGLWPCFLTIW